jgi:ubiquinone biosynthesis protein COQ4
MKQLIANKEETEHVFYIIEALDGQSALKDFNRFMATPAGQAEFNKRSYLPSLLDNHAPLHDLPEGSVGRTYVEFMEREGLSAAGLVAESEKRPGMLRKHEDDLLWYGNRLRDTHDMFHILTGYGRDALGEAALLGFTHSQHGGLGISFIAFMGGRQIARHAPRAANIKGVIREGRRNGKAARRIIEQDIEALLPRQLDEVRAELNIQPPLMYQHAHEVLRTHGIDPYAPDTL